MDFGKDIKIDFKLDTKKTVFIIFLLCLIPFSIYLFRADFIGADSYYYLYYVCYDKTPDMQPLNAPILSNIIFSLLPCNFFAIKLLLFLLMFTSVIIVWRLGMLFNKDSRAWLWFFLAPTSIGHFLKPEDDVFAFPLLFLSYYCFYKGKLEGNPKYFMFAAFLIAFSFLLWKGSGLYLLAFAVSSLYFLIIAIPSALYFLKDIWVGIKPNFEVMENLPLVGFAALNLLLIGYFSVEALLIPTIGFWTVLLLMNSKFVLHLAPLLAVCVDKRFQKWNEDRKVIFVILTICVLFSYSLASLTFTPRPHETQAVDYAISKSYELGYEGKVYNDWGYGYYIFFRGGTANDYGWTSKNFGKGIILTKEEEFDCPILKEFKEIKVYDCSE